MQTIKDSIKTIAVSLLILSLMSIAYAYVWKEPLFNPPSGNVPAPINTGSITQYKSGAFGVGGLFEVSSSGIKFANGTIQKTAYTIPCVTPWGSSVPSGQSVTAYREQSVPYNKSCVSETRTCDNGNLSGSYQYQSCTVAPPPPTVSLSIDQWYAQDGVIPTNYSPNRTVWTNDYPITLRWTTSNAVSCVASGNWSGGKLLSGTETFYPASAVTYTITCSNAVGSTAKTVSIPIVKQWQDVSGQGNEGESCREWLARTGQAGVDGSEPIAPERYQDHGYGECWYAHNGTQDADLKLTYTEYFEGNAFIYNDYPFQGYAGKSSFYTQTRR